MDRLNYTNIDDTEIYKDAYDFIFSVSDRIEYLNGAWSVNHLDDIKELYGTPLEGFIPALISRKKGGSWGIEGDIYAFKLTDEVKKIVTDCGLKGMLKVGNDITFENATLYKGDKKLFSCCSHEGYTFIDDEFNAALSEVCCKAIEKATCYADMLKVYNVVRQETKEARSREKSILRLTQGYIMQDGKAYIYQEPSYKCTFDEYKRIAKKYLQPELCKLLNGAKTFADLHPNGYPQRIDEFKDREKFKNLPEEDELITGINRDLFYLGYIENKFNDDTNDVESDSTPSAIISEEITTENEDFIKNNKDS